MSKGYSGLFHGTLGTTHVNGTQNSPSYSDRGIEIPEHIKQTLSMLKDKGDMVSGSSDSYPMKDVSIMSKEAHVEFARVTIGNKTYLIRGDKNGVVIPDKLLKKMAQQGGNLDFHSHPHDNDCIPSIADRRILKHLKEATGQSSSQIVTPNGRTVTFNENGVLSINTIPNTINESLKKAYLDLWR